MKENKYTSFTFFYGFEAITAAGILYAPLSSSLSVSSSSSSYLEFLSKYPKRSFPINLLTFFLLLMYKLNNVKLYVSIYW